MASTPKATKGRQAGQSKLTQQIIKVREEGVEEGRRQGRNEVLQYLERRYVHGTDEHPLPDRGSDRAEAILDLVADIVKEFPNK